MSVVTSAATVQLHVQETSATARWYEGPGGGNPFDERRPYSAICSMFFLGNKKVFIYGLQGNITRDMVSALAKELLRRGFEEVIMERRGTYVTHRIDKFIR